MAFSALGFEGFRVQVLRGSSDVGFGGSGLLVFRLVCLRISGFRGFECLGLKVVLLRFVFRDH